MALTINLTGVEPAFAKNTAFNKNFGTSSGDILLLGSTSVASKVLVTDSNNKVKTSSTTETQLSYLDATSSIQTQLGNKEGTANKDATGGYVGLTLFKINFKNVLNTFTSFFTNSNTAARTYTFPDKDGTVAMTSDITGTNSGTNTGDETAARIGTLINGSSAAIPNDADLVATADSSVLKKITWTNVKTFLKTYFDSIYQAILTAANVHTFVDTLTAMTTPVDADRMIIVDNSASLAKKITWANIKATLKSYFDTIYATLASPTFTGTVTSPAIILSSETASTIASFDASKNIKSLSTATYPSLTELSYVKGVTQSIQPLLIDTRTRKVAVQSNTDASTSATTAETVLKTLLVPTLGANTTLKIMAHCGKVGTGSNAVFKMYYNTTADLSGSPVQIALSNFIAASLFAPFNRDITNKNSVTANSVFPATSSSATEALASVARTDINVDLSGKYIVITGKAGVVGDSVRVDNARLLIEE